MNTRAMKQPRKDVLRDQLVLAADEIIRLRGVIDTICRMHTWREYHGQAAEKGKAPWWFRIFRRRS